MGGAEGRRSPCRLSPAVLCASVSTASAASAATSPRRCSSATLESRSPRSTISSRRRSARTSSNTTRTPGHLRATCAPMATTSTTAADQGHRRARSANCRGRAGVDVVVESTGSSPTPLARAHIDSGGAKVIISPRPARHHDRPGRQRPPTTIRRASHHLQRLVRRTAWDRRSRWWSTNSAGSKGSCRRSLYTNDQVADGPHKTCAALCRHETSRRQPARRNALTRFRVKVSFDFARASRPDRLDVRLVANVKRRPRAANSTRSSSCWRTAQTRVAVHRRRARLGASGGNPYSSIVDGKLTNALGDHPAGLWYDSRGLLVPRRTSPMVLSVTVQSRG